MTLNIFVLGLDELNLASLRAIPGAERYTFHQLLTREELQFSTATVPELVDRATNQLDAFDGSIDAIVGYWDFPVSTMLPILCGRYSLRSADLEAVVKCEHKYWSRRVQQQVIDEIPGFGTVKLTDTDATLPAGLTYPAWVKPIKSASSEGAYYIEDDDELHAALEREYQQIGRMRGRFHETLAQVDLPPAIAAMGPATCLVEEAATGQQATVEGFSSGGEVEVYGVVDSITYPHVPSFLRYEYPSRLPEHVRDYMADVSRRVITAIGLTNSAFNIEFFWDDAKQRLTLLEINARHSQSHARLFHLVDGAPNHVCMLDIALGRRPTLPRREGDYSVAALWMLRCFTDGIPRRVPSSAEIAELEARIPGTTVEVVARQGRRLSEGYRGDSYSYVLARIVVAGHTRAEVEETYHRCAEALPFEIEDT